MTERTGEDEPGPLGEEAAKLFGAAQDWLHRALADPLAGARISTGAAECAFCPVCQLIAVLRGQRPEISEKFAETQLALAGLLRALADGVATMASPPAPSPGGSRVQRIDLGGEGSDDGAETDLESGGC